MPLPAAEFHTALANDELAPATENIEETTAGIILAGVVKLADGDNNRIRFSPGATCGNWFDVPLVLIHEGESLGKLPCGDHKHDFVLLQLTAPTTLEAKLLTNLLRHTSEMLEDIEENSDADIEILCPEIEEPVSDATAFSLAGFRTPRFRLPRIRPPRIAIPLIVPRQIERISRFSSCAKCKMYAEAVLVGLVAAAFAAAGAGTGPSVLTALKLALQRQFGAAAAEAALSAAFSHNHKQAAKIICRVHGKC